MGTSRGRITTWATNKLRPYDMIQEITTTGKFKGKDAFAFNIFGRRAGFTSITVLNDVKEFDNGVALIPTLSNSTLDIISSSVNDTNTAGTGARKVKVTYIDVSNNMVQSADINLNGTTLVTNVLTGVNEVLWMEVTELGSGTVAAGNIRLRINGGTVEVEQVTAGTNKSMSARFMIPTGYTGFIDSWDCEAVNNDQEVRLRVTMNCFTGELSNIYHFMDSKSIATNSNSGHQPLSFIQIPALARIKVSTISAGTAAAVKCGTSFILVLLKN